AFLGLEERPSTPAALERPFGLAARPGGPIVADPDGRRVLALTWPGGAASEVACAGRRFAEPLAVATGPDGALYVADAGAGVLVRVDSVGACRALGAGVLVRPTGVAAMGGRLWVVDPPAHAVVALTPDGREVSRFGARGDRGPGLNFPTALCATAQGTLLVVDALNFRVAEFAPDGTFLGAFGEPGEGGGAFGRPKAIAVDEKGRIYVTDALNDVVVVFSRERRFEFAIGGDGAGAGELTLPAGVAVAGSRLYVADSYNRRIAVYDLLATEGPP
ncbi:MAG: 6-bladed beta-propeller, partial [Myxococcota bacterium]